MKRLILLAKLALATLCVSSLAYGANIKVVCINDSKHDRAKLVQAMSTAISGDKIVIIGTCAPKGVQATTRKSYQSNLGGVIIYETTNPIEYESWKFDREIGGVSRTTDEAKANKEENANEDAASEEDADTQDESASDESESEDSNDEDDGGDDSGDDSGDSDDDGSDDGGSDD